jgi:hypothetical protein
MVAKDPSPTPASSNRHEAPYEATWQAMGSVPEEASTPPAALSLKWAGVTLLVIAVLLAVYLGAGLLGELAARATYP